MSLLKSLKRPIAKSEYELAWVPSLPIIPMPTWADYIILTSLAPSPIAKVVRSGLQDLTNLTSLALSDGDALKTTSP